MTAPVCMMPVGEFCGCRWLYLPQLTVTVYRHGDNPEHQRGFGVSDMLGELCEKGHIVAVEEWIRAVNDRCREPVSADA